MNADVGRWITGRDTGTSSETIWAAFVTGHLPDGGGDVPYDPADFGRCYRLLLLAPEWRQNLSVLAKLSPKWAQLVAAWDELDAMYRDVLAGPNGWDLAASKRMYERMRVLRGFKP